MKILLGSLGFIALSATVLPSILVSSGAMELGTHKTIMWIAMVVWFITAPYIMSRKDSL